MKNLKYILFSIISLSILWGFSFASNPFVRNLLGTQLEIWLNRRSLLWSSWNWNALSIHQELIQWNQYDLISELDKAKTENDRLSILNNYISVLNWAMSDGAALYDYEQSTILDQKE